MTSAASEVVGRGGAMMGVERKGDRGGAFDHVATAAPSTELSGKPAQSVEGWVLIASNLDPETKEADVKDFFSDFGVVRNVKVSIDHRLSQCIGHAFVEFTEIEAANEAVSAGSGSEFVGGKPIRIDFAFVHPESVSVDAKSDTRKRGADETSGAPRVPQARHEADVVVVSED